MKKHIVINDAQINDAFTYAKKKCVDIIIDRSGVQIKKISDETAVKMLADAFLKGLKDGK